MTIPSGILFIFMNILKSVLFVVSEEFGNLYANKQTDKVSYAGDSIDYQKKMRFQY